MHKTNAEMRACPKCEVGTLDFTKDMGLIKCDKCDYERLPELPPAAPINKRLQRIKCPDCGVECIGPQGLAAHIRFTHKGYKYPKRKLSKEPVPEVESFVCPVCGMSFDRSIERAGHMAIHSKQPKEVMPILDNAEKQIKQIILATHDGKRDLYKICRRRILEAIETLL